MNRFISRKTKSAVIAGITLSSLLGPAFAQMPETSIKEENHFIQLNPPPPHSYKTGSLKKYLEGGKRYVEFAGTTAIPVYFSKNAEYVNKPIWVPDPQLSMGRWVWIYHIDCEENTFDRENDQVGWRSVRWDPTAVSAAALFCPTDKWNTLPQK